MEFLLLIPVAAALLFFLTGLRVAQEYERSLVFHLGRFTRVKGPGLFWIIPVLQRIRTVDLRTSTVDLESQETISRDSVSIKVSAILWYRIAEPTKAILNVEDYFTAAYEVAVTTMRNIVGQHELDDIIKNREKLNATIRKQVDEATAPWGIHIEMIEIKDVEIPEMMQRAMAREAEAMREKRARLIKAEAEYESSKKLTQGADAMAKSPIALELRRMQMISEIGTEQNTTTVVLMPSEFSDLARSITKHFGPKK